MKWLKINQKYVDTIDIKYLYVYGRYYIFLYKTKYFIPPKIFFVDIFSLVEIFCTMIKINIEIYSKLLDSCYLGTYKVLLLKTPCYL